MTARSRLFATWRSSPLRVPPRSSGSAIPGSLRAALITRYFGRFPADGALLLVLPAPGNQIHGRARGIGGASILFFLGTDLDAAQARRSWELVHELVHLGFPSLPRRHHWAEEGLATYVEPIARARDRKSTRLNSSHLVISY